MDGIELKDGECKVPWDIILLECVGVCDPSYTSDSVWLVRVTKLRFESTDCVASLKNGAWNQVVVSDVSSNVILKA